MPSPIVPIDRIRAEFDRIKSNAYEFSEPEICILVAANLLIPIESVTAVCLQPQTESNT